MIKNRLSGRKKLILFGGILVVLLLLGALELSGTTNLVGNKHPVDKASKTTSDAPSAQSDFQAKSSDKKEPSSTSGKSEATVSDTKGATQPQAGAVPLVSKDGVISVYSPSANGVFASGSSLTGKSSAPRVSYRLMDDVSGVTATGDLVVTGGNFSGKFSFSTNATQGRLDVFKTGVGGVEESIIEIPVRFK